MRQLRSIGIDDAGFARSTSRVKCVGTACRGETLEGVFSFYVKRDGFDAAQRIARAALGSGFFQGTRVLLVSGVALAGLNVIDLRVLSAELSVPVISVTATRPSPQRMRRAILSAPSPERRVKVFDSLGSVFEASAGGRRLFFHCAGVGEKNAAAILSSFGGFPLPLRLAHVIARGI